MSEIEKLARSIKEAGRKHQKVATAWVTVKSVDWNKKTMTATGVTDDLDYFSVLLGIGATYYNPKVGCLALVGIIEANEASAFLITAEELDETVYNGGDNKGLVNVDPLVAAINQVQQNILQLAQMTSTAIAVYSGALDGGASAGTFVGQIAGLTNPDLSDIEDKKIKH